MNKIEIDFLDNKLVLETGKLAKQANGAVTIQHGKTVILTTAVSNDTAGPDVGFFPLTCQFLMKYYSHGKFPGGFIKRENRPSDHEILMSRLMDRPIRPLFEKWFAAETQVISTVLSYDKACSPESFAILGASASLMLSDMPFSQPIAGVRVGYVNEQFVANAHPAVMKDSALNLFMVASKDAIVMVEAHADQVSEEIMLEALDFGYNTVQPLIQIQEELVKIAGKTKKQAPPEPESVVDSAEISAAIGAELKKALFEETKIERNKLVAQVKASAIEKYAADDEKKQKAVTLLLNEMTKKIIRQEILENQKRVDARTSKDIRPITCELGILPNAHGSALFTRGETQALVTLTLGTKEDAQIIDNGISNEQKRFYLHYNFPSYSVGEARRMGPPNRREIGHGRLAEKSIQSLLPVPDQNFPYTIRLVSEILESNGSSSMATVCGSSLALMDGGVPLTTAVAGIAMGLVKEGDKYIILSDILGDEDHVGDMDFKVAGTNEGITGLQMDIKIAGLSQDLLKEALTQAKEGRLHILDNMNGIISESKSTLASNAPRYVQYKVDTAKIKKIIGTGGQTIKSIVSQTGVKIDISDNGMVNIAAYDQKSAEAALNIIQSLTKELEPGEVYEGVVKKVTSYGAYLECLPGIDGYLHIADITHRHVDDISDYLKDGQVVKVRAQAHRDKRGNVRLSSKEFMD